MQISNSQTELLLHVSLETLRDVYDTLSCLDVLTVKQARFGYEKDASYISSRTRNEGISFLTITLPKLGEWFDSILCPEKEPRTQLGFKAHGLFDDDSMPYGPSHWSLRSPVFLRPVWSWLATYLDLVLLDEIQGVTELHALLHRQIRTLLFGLKKLDVPCSDDRINATIDSFITDECTMNCEDDEFVSKTVELSQILLRLYFGDGGANPYVPECKRPRHGPGAVAGGERHSKKWEFSHLFESVHTEWPYWDFMFPVRSVTTALDYGYQKAARPLQLAACVKQWRSLTRLASPTSRFLMVPKDSKGPRLICCEPKELMYLQQGVSVHLMDYIECHEWTRGRVNFTDQSINAKLALEQSSKRDFGTIDLRSASDLVSVSLIKTLFPKRVADKWLALRSTRVSLPNEVASRCKEILANFSQSDRLVGNELSVRKFAPMGSALCFPVESLTFWALLVGSVWNQTNSLNAALSSVWVYGDDIVIDVRYAQKAINDLESVGLSVNTAKSFYGNERFRESCGIDAYNGANVTPYRIKKLPPLRSTDGESLVAWIKYAENSLEDLPHRSAACLRLVEDLLGCIPKVPFAQPYLSMITRNYWTFQDWEAKCKLTWDSARCYYRTKIFCVKSREIPDAPDSWHRLQRDLIESFAERAPDVVVDRQSTQIRKKLCNITYLLQANL